MVEAKSIVVGTCCVQLLWIMQQIHDLDINLREITIKCGNKSAINTTKILLQHSRTKYILFEIMYKKEM